MAKSLSGWHGVSKESRFCAYCGQTLTLKTKGGLWMDGLRGEVYHCACWAKARKAEVTND